LAPAHDDRHISRRHIDSFVEYTRRNKDPQFACAEALKGFCPLFFPDVTGDRLYEMFQGHRVGSVIVGRENESPGAMML
jgi:hypothetical protein